MCDWNNWLQFCPHRDRFSNLCYWKCCLFYFPKWWDRQQWDHIYIDRYLYITSVYAHMYIYIIYIRAYHLLLIYVCNFHVLNHFLMIYICKFNLFNLSFGRAISCFYDDGSSYGSGLCRWTPMETPIATIVQPMSFSGIYGKLLLIYICNFHVL